MNNAEQFLLRVPDLHDGSLNGLVLRQGGLDLHCRAEDGTAFSIRLEGLERLRVTEFREGNTIIDVFVYPGDACPDHLVRSAYGIDQTSKEPWFDRVVATIQREQWTLLFVHCAVGGEVFGLAREGFQIHQVDEIT